MQFSHDRFRFLKMHLRMPTYRSTLRCNIDFVLWANGKLTKAFSHAQSIMMCTSLIRVMFFRLWQCHNQKTIVSHSFLILNSKNTTVFTTVNAQKFKVWPKYIHCTVFWLNSFVFIAFYKRRGYCTGSLTGSEPETLKIEIPRMDF